MATSPATGAELGAVVSPALRGDLVRLAARRRRAELIEFLLLADRQCAIGQPLAARIPLAAALKSLGHKG